MSDPLADFAQLQTCPCRACLAALDRQPQGMTLCPSCGCKRCPQATNHAHACTGSNDGGQYGSAYGEDCEQPCCDEYRAATRRLRQEWDQLFGDVR